MDSYALRQPELLPFNRQDSSIISSLPWVNGLVHIPTNIPVRDGDWVDYYDLARWHA